MAYNPANTRLGNYDVTWHGTFLGSVDKVTPIFDWTTKPIKLGSLGDVVLGNRVVGMTFKIKVELREINLALIQTLMPWYTTGADVALMPTPGVDLYTYAQTLLFHPTDITGTTEDLTLGKAVPIFQPMERDGMKDDVVIAGFDCFPDRTQFPALVYGHYGT